MDYIDAKELVKVSVQINNYALELRSKLVKQAQLKVKLDNILRFKMDDLLRIKKNIGQEMAVILALKDSEELRAVYAEHTVLVLVCDGLKRIIDSLQCQIMLAQSLMKFTQKEGG
jgi:hypothetical protein